MKHCDVCGNIAEYSVGVPELLRNYNLCTKCKDDAATHFAGVTVCWTPTPTGHQHLASYKQLEASPIYASNLLTVADAEELERKGIPSPVSGDLNVYPYRVKSA